MNFVEKIKKEYRKAYNECNINLGDKVKITKEFITHEAGCEIAWVSKMANTVGEVGEVTGKTDVGIMVETIYGKFVYPFFVLEKVEKEEEEFKPGDLVIAPMSFSAYSPEWVVTMFSHKKIHGYVTASGILHDRCKKLEGNEHLIGKPVEE